MVFLSGNASDSSNCTHPPAPVNISKAILLGVILGGLILFGVLGNILVILSVACHRHLHSVTHYYIVNLAVADLLLTSTVLPFSAIFEILGYWAFGRVFCNIWAAVDVLCCTASIISLCVISIDRYIGVSYPLRYPTIVTQRRGLRALLCVWAFSLVISVGPLFGWRQPAPDDETICQINEEPGYVLFSALGSFYVPLTIILAMYCRVYVVAKRESRGLKSGLKTDKSDSEQVTLRIHRKNAPAGGSGVASAKNKTHFSVRLLKFSREKKAAKTLGIVVGCFVLCWLPFFLVMPIGSVDSERERDREKGLPLPLVHPPMAAVARALQPAHCADPKAGPRCFSWSPMGCRAQALGPSFTAFLGHSRELAWKRGNRDRIRCPDRD
ncbi:alpha-1A adrenergic receptor isoform X4 [Oryctolagus cuniculus]|uniref:alpha-1A adrenergic receptor isoform X4 n=1 Tax=Oryctolagus cuniculus TaxID=9986 RepID=UPI0038796058